MCFGGTFRRADFQLPVSDNFVTWISLLQDLHDTWLPLPFYIARARDIMFYDLNVPYSPDDPEVPHTLNFLAERKSLCQP